MIIINKYEYITITDGDLYVIDSKKIFNELRNKLDLDAVCICTSTLFQENSYLNPNRIIGIDNFRNKMNNYKSVNLVTYNTAGCWLLTFKSINLHLFNNIHFIDSNVAGIIRHNDLKWANTTENLAYHITWDLYLDNNEYYKFKLKNPGIWNILKYSDYRILK